MYDFAREIADAERAAAYAEDGFYDYPSVTDLDVLTDDEAHEFLTEEEFAEREYMRWAASQS